jgi:hypothetical protein
LLTADVLYGRYTQQNDDCKINSYNTPNDDVEYIFKLLQTVFSFVLCKSTSFFDMAEINDCFFFYKSVKVTKFAKHLDMNNILYPHWLEKSLILYILW